MREPEGLPYQPTIMTVIKDLHEAQGFIKAYAPVFAE